MTITDDRDDKDIYTKMAEMDEEMRRRTRMYFIIWHTLTLSRRLAAVSGSMYEQKHLHPLWKDEYSLNFQATPSLQVERLATT